MINLKLPLIGAAAALLPTLQAIPKREDRFAVLLHGDPGTGKSHVLDLFALALTKSEFAIESFNGQSVSVETVREWKARGRYGNLFSDWTVKRIDEIDRASDAAQAELLTWLDYLPPNFALLTTTNEYGKLCKNDKGRLQRRFAQFEVVAPPITEAAPYLEAQFGLPPAVASEIARGAVPSGVFDGVNMGAAVKDAQAFLAALDAKKAA